MVLLSLKWSHEWSPRSHDLLPDCLVCMGFYSLPEQATPGLPRVAALSSEHPCQSASLTRWLTAQICTEHGVTYPFAACGLNKDTGRHPGTGAGAVVGSPTCLVSGEKKVGQRRWSEVGMGREKDCGEAMACGFGVAAEQPHSSRLWS